MKRHANEKCTSECISLVASVIFFLFDPPRYHDYLHREVLRNDRELQILSNQCLRGRNFILDFNFQF